MEKTGEELKTRVKNLRIKAALTQVALATMADLSVQTIKDIEAGRRGIGYDSIKKLSGAFGISIEELTGEASPEPKVIREVAPVSKLLARLSVIPDEVFNALSAIDPNNKEGWEAIVVAINRQISVQKEKKRSEEASQA